MEPRSHAGRLVERLRRRGRRAHGAAGPRHADRGIGAASRRLLRGGRASSRPTVESARSASLRSRGAWTTWACCCRSGGGCRAGAPDHGRSRSCRPSLRGATGEDFVAALAEPGAPADRRAAGARRNAPSRPTRPRSKRFSRCSARRAPGSRTLPLRDRSRASTPPEIRWRASEAAAFHRDLYGKHAAEYPKHIGEAVKAGLGLTAVDYLAAQAHRRAFRADMSVVAARYDALVSPTAAGPLPRDSTPRGSVLLRAVELGGDAVHFVAYRSRRRWFALRRAAHGNAVGARPACSRRPPGVSARSGFRRIHACDGGGHARGRPQGHRCGRVRRTGYPTECSSPHRGRAGARTLRRLSGITPEPTALAMRLKIVEA